jgi:hypothetical protein
LAPPCDMQLLQPDIKCVDLSQISQLVVTLIAHPFWR